MTTKYYYRGYGRLLNPMSSPYRVDKNMPLRIKAREMKNYILPKRWRKKSGKYEHLYNISHHPKNVGRPTVNNLMRPGIKHFVNRYSQLSANNKRFVRHQLGNEINSRIYKAMIRNGNEPNFNKGHVDAINIRVRLLNQITPGSHKNGRRNDWIRWLVFALKKRRLINANKQRHPFNPGLKIGGFVPGRGTFTTRRKR